MSDEADRLYEHVLVLRCQTGDEAAYRELVGRFGPRLRYFLLKLSSQPHVDDLVQETWLDVLRQLPRLKDAGAFTTWLYRIAHGKAMLDGRRNGREPVSTRGLDEVIDHGSEQAFTPEDAAAIHAALDRLEPPHREVLVLRFLEELSYEQIAQVVDCPLGTVRSRIHHAKTKLQQIMRSK